MGIAGSALPEKLSLDELKNLCGNEFKEDLYHALKDGDGTVNKDKFLAIATNSQEREVMNLFFSFVGMKSKEMESKTFVKLCKDCKLMNKKNFTSTDCDLLFSKTKAKLSLSSKGVGYTVFRDYLLPGVAEKKGVSMEKLIEKLAQSEGPVLHATHADSVKFHDDQSTYTGAHAKGGPSFTPDGSAVRMEDHLDRKDADVRGVKEGEGQSTAAGTGPKPVGHSEEQHDAALKLQAIQRKREAKKKVTELKEIKVAAENVDHDKHFDKPKDDATERDVQTVFNKFCGSADKNGQMDSRTFLKLCKDTGLIQKKFTAGDADLAFQKAKTIASAPGAGAYSSGVVHGKRVEYSVFRSVAVPIIAEKTKQSIDDVLSTIASCAGPVLHATQAQATRFHDDQSTYTGAHSQGGPSFHKGDTGGAVEMEGLLDREEANVRGIK